MDQAVVDTLAAELMEPLEGAIDDLLELDLDGLPGRDVLDILIRTERLAGRLAAVQNRLLGAVDRRDLHRDDGHATAKVFLRHVGRVSNGEALARSKAMKALRDLPDIAIAFEAGSIGTAQVQLLGKVHANPRVCAAMPDAQETFLDWASALSFRDFERSVRRWERLVDQDGPEPANERNHDNRDARLIQDHFSLGWNLRAGYAALQGAAMRDIFDHYIEAELAADWEQARIEHGDDVCFADLPRRDSHRRADALWQIFQDAAGADDSAVPTGFVHNIMWDAATFEEMVARMAGRDAQPFEADSFRCETIDGVDLEPTEAAANAAVNQVRRVVVDTAGVVLDLGRARFFTGNARTAVNLQSDVCIWPGCEVPSTRCEADHLIEHSRGGGTNPENGAPLCGKHNRWKQKGFAIHRDPAGTWHTVHPDGTPILC